MSLPKPYYSHAGITIYHGDCREILPHLPKVDLVLTDPPYGIGADKAGAHSSIRDNPSWSAMGWDEGRVDAETTMLIRLHGERCAIWGGNYYADLLPPSSAWLCWRKPEAETGFSLADVELCWTNSEGAARCKTFNRRDGNLHPTQKPVAVMIWTLQQFPNAQTILDPFMGSGTTLVAAKQLGRRAIGIEIERKYCDIAVERLAQENLFGFTDTGATAPTQGELI